MSKTKKPPVQVSGQAVKALGDLARRWAEDTEVTLSFSVDTATAHTDLRTKQVVLNPDLLVRNPNRVLNMITPFRLRQEALVTGALLHEVAHLRYSKWMPRSKEDRLAMRHGDGAPVSDSTRALATTLEEPRIEGKMSKDLAQLGGAGLEWTMRATAAAIVPPTPAAMDPSQQIVDLLGSWALRRGRLTALGHRTTQTYNPMWARHFDSLVQDALWKWGIDRDLGRQVASDVWALLNDSLISDDDGIELLDNSREILRLLFPEGAAPTVSVGGCSTSDEDSESDTSDPSDDDEGEGDEGEGDGDDGEGGSGEGAPDDDLTEALGQVESMAEDAEAEEAAEQEAAPIPTEDSEHVSSVGSSQGSGATSKAWRQPTPDERRVQRDAESFLREIIAPTEGVRRSLSETPSATVDGAAMSAWKAAGRVGEPTFFIRTRREVVDAPPARIAILVDVSGSMSSLQKPSALLSWALSCAAADLRNFAGRGRQVESCLIHWGDTTPDVVQRNGEVLPGLREVECDQGTTAMGAALAAVEEEMPGFFDQTEAGKDENRLLLQFTDWELSMTGAEEAHGYTARALLNGVNMLTVAPNLSVRSWGGASHLPYIEKAVASHNPKGRSEVVIYRGGVKPEVVWAAAKKVLRG